MCTGLELALLGGAGLLGGSALQSRAVSKKADAADKAALAGLKRQDMFDQQKAGVYQEALGDIGTELSAAERDKAAEDITGDIRANQNRQDVTFQNPSMEGPKVLQSRADQGTAEGSAYLDLLSDARGRLGAWGTGMQDLGEKWGRHAWNTDRLSLDAINDANIAQAEAQHEYASTGNKTAMGGNIMSQLGALMLTQGAFNMGAGTPPGTGVPSVVNPNTGAINPAAGVPIKTPAYNPYAALA